MLVAHVVLVLYLLSKHLEASNSFEVVITVASEIVYLTSPLLPLIWIPFAFGLLTLVGLTIYKRVTTITEYPAAKRINHEEIREFHIHQDISVEDHWAIDVIDDSCYSVPIEEILQRVLYPEYYECSVGSVEEFVTTIHSNSTERQHVIDIRYEEDEYEEDHETLPTEEDRPSSSSLIDHALSDCAPELAHESFTKSDPSVRHSTSLTCGVELMNKPDEVERTKPPDKPSESESKFQSAPRCKFTPPTTRVRERIELKIQKLWRILVEDSRCTDLIPLRERLGRMLSELSRRVRAQKVRMRLKQLKWLQRRPSVRYKAPVRLYKYTIQSNDRTNVSMT